MPAPYLALGLAGPHLNELTGSADLLARWDALPIAFTVLGIDRIDGRGPAPLTLDSSAVGAILAGRTSRARFLVVASPQRDHPYNLARRVASLGHLSRGRSGVLFGVADAYAAPGPDATGAWGGAGLGVGAPLTAATALDTARAVRALEQSWPYDSIIGDRETGILVQSDQIVHIDHDGAYHITGPLNAPEPATGASLIAWYASTPDDVVAADSAPVDLVVGVGGSVRIAPLGLRPADSDAGGVLLRPTLDQSLDEVLTEAERLLADGFTPVTPGGPLRAALGLATPARPAGGRAAFPVPEPQPSL
ncbi:LLM class flavin-dependent oxidoreductase [Dactylosporangium sp. NPDC000555]|uniref:LLM class flavin-dependent oxidoreductase n=1 Tax=Dactylosporangium sp. NPDC000555 TaxID=3154260 RepID=UPI00332390D6